MLKEEELQLPGLVNPDDARVNKDIEIANQAVFISIILQETAKIL